MKYPEPILQFFEYAHLPARLQEVSHPFASLAHFVVDGLFNCEHPIFGSIAKHGQPTAHDAFERGRRMAEGLLP